MTLSGWLQVAAVRYILIFSLDLVAISAAFFFGYWIRFDGGIPPAFMDQFWSYLWLLLIIRLPSHSAFRIHRWSYRLSGFYEALRVIVTCATGTVGFVTASFLLQRGGPPRSVIVLEFLLTTSFLGALRFSPRLTLQWYHSFVSARSDSRIRCLIVGATNAGELLTRELERSDDNRYEVVGFVDDNPIKWRTSIAGRPVMGAVGDLPKLVERHQVKQLFFASPELSRARLLELLSACADLELGYKVLPPSINGLTDRIPMGSLHELAPEDLLMRPPVRFDREKMNPLIAGRCLLVTGAAGSIGSEICRQAAASRPRLLVMTDVNENGLYLLFRHLERMHPELDVRVEVADIRDTRAMSGLFERYGIQDVFHAAAHKHVPLMEEAPEQAIKNNVTGCRNVAVLASEHRVERFVLISTDKAVEPSNVMGASKLIAEMVVRDLARRSATRFHTVRFGNVLGSAGSVVPLFEAQIQQGGPVTVTHPDCRRYAMTVNEAVGLVLLAGLSDAGHLCVLEMGDPIRILDLARSMITMSGQVPGREIQIVCTGLRPGEKLDEQLMTKEEAAMSRLFEETIRVVEPRLPTSETLACIEELERLALQEDRPSVIRGIQKVLPEYEPSQLWNAEAGITDASRDESADVRARPVDPAGVAS
jgi:FlaA1/EpsC-like NDP-sugar epimerase